jgi:sugar phosphate isomerase/epimerase
MENWNIRDKVAAQMYTVREHTKTSSDLELTLKTLAKIGYPAVQMSAVGAMNGEAPEVSAKLAREMLDDNGLKCIATHRDWSRLVNRTDDEITFHKTLNCDYIAIGSIPGEYAQDAIAGYQRWIEDALKLSSKLSAAEIRFGYHNHHFEFEKLGESRTSFYDLLASNTASGLFFELDVYWAQHAGYDPVRVIESLHGKLPVVHVKDKEVVGGEPVMAPVGEGNLDWPRIIPALAAAGTEWYCVEQDDYLRDPFDCLKSSYNYLSRR